MDFLKNTPKWLVISVGVAIVGVFAINVVLYGYSHTWFSKKEITDSAPIPAYHPEPTATPTPRPIPHGKKGFTVSSGKKTGPQFSRGVIDPYDPASGEKQIISVSLASTSPVSNITATVKSDHKEVSVPFVLIEGIGTDGRWEGTIVYSDTYFYTYNVKLVAKDEAGETNEVELTLR